MKLAEHLGGHANKTHIDEGALSWAINELKISSMLDIGCGPGDMVKLSEQKGLTALGIEGDHTLERYYPERFLIHDCRLGPAPLENNFDLAWSVEFVEHVYAEFIPNYMQAFQKCKYVIMTYAPPGHGGYHHVNEQPEAYWVDIFSQYGFTVNTQFAQELRNVSTMNLGKKLKKAFVKNRGMVFIKNG